MKFRKIKEIQKVKAFDPKTEVYSVYEPAEGILFNEVFIPLENVPLDIIAIDQKIFTVDGAGCLKIWEEGILTETIENADLLSPSNDKWVEKFYFDKKEYTNYSNLLDLETNKLILKENIPYQLYAEKNIIIAYADEEDRIYKMIGIVHGNLWVYTQQYRLIALDIETGSVQYHIDCFGVQLDEVTKNIFSIASNGWTVIDTQTLTVKESYFFSEEDPNMGQYKSIFDPLLQGDYFTFVGSKPKEHWGIGWIGIFDYKARKLVWEHELISEEERKNTRNHLAATQPLYMSGNKLYIKDIKDNLYIFEREE